MIKQANHNNTSRSSHNGLHVVTPQATPTSSTSDIVDESILSPHSFISSSHGYHQEIKSSSRGDMMSVMGEREKGSLGIYRSIQEGTHSDAYGLSTYMPSQLIMDHCHVATTTSNEDPNQCYVPYHNPNWLWELIN